MDAKALKKIEKKLSNALDRLEVVVNLLDEDLEDPKVIKKLLKKIGEAADITEEAHFLLHEHFA